jgi:hypothetical protein
MLTPEQREQYYSTRPKVIRRRKINRLIACVFLLYAFGFSTWFIFFNNF